MEQDRAPPLLVHHPELARQAAALQAIVELIGATTTKTGLKARAELDQNFYPKGIAVSDAELAEMHLRRHDFHGDWNYTIGPRSPR